MESANPEHVSISEEDEAILVATRSGAAYVLSHLARTCRPGRGAAPLLRALGQIARIAVEAVAADRPHWFFGTLSVDIISETNLSTRGGSAGIFVDVMTDHGGPREALFPRFCYAIPFEEFRWMVDRVPDLAGPLHLRNNQSRFSAITLYVPASRTSDRTFRAEVPSKMIVSEDSFFDPDSTSPVPALMEELARSAVPSTVDPLER